MIEFLTFAVLNLIAAISPGPDFAVVTKFALKGIREHAILASLGVAMALMIHMTYAILGVAILLDSAPHVFTIIRLIGACYLLYLGIGMLFDGKKKAKEKKPSFAQGPFISGFLTNLLNPKAALFLVSLIAQFVTEQTPLVVKFCYWGVVPLIGFGWFSFLSYLLTHPRIYSKIERYQKRFTLIMGLFLIAIAAVVIASTVGLV